MRLSGIYLCCEVSLIVYAFTVGLAIPLLCRWPGYTFGVALAWLCLWCGVGLAMSLVWDWPV